jgi:hypothetical protein
MLMNIRIQGTIIQPPPLFIYNIYLRSLIWDVLLNFLYQLQSVFYMKPTDSDLQRLGLSNRLNY